MFLGLLRELNFAASRLQFLPSPNLHSIDVGVLNVNVIIEELPSLTALPSLSIPLAAKGSAWIFFRPVDDASVIRLPGQTARTLTTSVIVDQPKVSVVL